MSRPATVRAASAVGLVGAGRAGSALALALVGAGYTVVAVGTRSESARARAAARFPAAWTGPAAGIADRLRQADLLLVAVPDDAIAQVTARLVAVGAVRAGQLLAHLSGRHGLAVLAAGQGHGAHRVALHPIMTLPGNVDEPDGLPGGEAEMFVGVPFGITADAQAIVAARRLVADIGGVPLDVPEEHRDQYHAALVLGGNFLASLTAVARDLLADVGIADPAAALSPLLHASLRNALAGGWAAATGPVRRADLGTLLAHQHALARVDPAAAEVYRALALFTAGELARAGLLDPVDAIRLRGGLTET
ncbi:hypothetical protein FAIPA1_30095 [Frankia sp. AiPs1]|uniref:Rossmann-like and DUF2520 domain-containing protein n=1 Tax=Frankia sp. AiPa1 TaxID=573492 RepID=UPI00202AF694|nr:Rossmann-like and DUF2520 domain-containing protein [Frankia sp. AiPa1]MCL9757846.1 DUF2520 domain-containing protein [Frankia sp. AiPa1]